MIEGFGGTRIAQIGSTETGLAATTMILSRAPVGGEMFLLTAPFIEPPRLRQLR